MGGEWNVWLEEAVNKLEKLKRLRSLRPLFTRCHAHSLLTSPNYSTHLSHEEFQTFDSLGAWDRSAVEVEISEPTFQYWMSNFCSTGCFPPYAFEILFSLILVFEISSSLI